MTNRVSPFLAAALAAAACVEPRTQVVVGMATDLRAPELIDAVVLRIEKDGVSVVEQEWSLEEQGFGEGVHLPGSIGLVPGGDASEPFTAVAAAEVNGDEVVTRTSTLTFVEGETLFLRLGLVVGCGQGLSCPPGQDCVEGRCLPIDIDASTLPLYGDGDEDRIACDSGTRYLRTGAGVETEALDPESECAPGERCQEGTCYRPSRGCRSYCSELAGCLDEFKGLQGEGEGEERADKERRFGARRWGARRHGGGCDEGCLAGCRKGCPECPCEDDCCQGDGDDETEIEETFETACMAECACHVSDCDADSRRAADECFDDLSCEGLADTEACLGAISCVGPNVFSRSCDYGGSDLGPCEREPSLDEGCNYEREWSFERTVDCSPGRVVSFSCCDCTGDPMLRADAGGACLGDDDDRGNGLCPALSVICPESGRIDVSSAPYSGGEYTCNWTSTEGDLDEGEAEAESEGERCAGFDSYYRGECCDDFDPDVAVKVFYGCTNSCRAKRACGADSGCLAGCDEECVAADPRCRIDRE